MDVKEMKFHHLGLAVKRPEEARSILEGMGYTVGEAVYDGLQNVNLILCSSPSGPDVEIIYPGEGETPLDGILRRFQAGIYHVCYETEDWEGVVAKLRERGIRARCVSEAKSAVLFGGDPVSFYQIPNFGLVEILHRGGGENSGSPATRKRKIRAGGDEEEAGE